MVSPASFRNPLLAKTRERADAASGSIKRSVPSFLPDASIRRSVAKGPRYCRDRSRYPSEACLPVDLSSANRFQIIIVIFCRKLRTSKVEIDGIITSKTSAIINMRDAAIIEEMFEKRIISKKI